MSKVLVCTNSACSSAGAGALVRDIEELAQGQCAVEEYGCLGHCGKGPNVEIIVDGSKKVKKGIKSFTKACQLLEDDAGIEIGRMAKTSGRDKFAIRRQQDAAERSKMIQKAFETLGGDKAEKTHPELLANLLVIRSKDIIKTQKADALRDATEAVRLAPSSSQALLALGNAYEAARLPVEAIQCLDAALDLGQGVNPTAVKRQRARLERKVSLEPAQLQQQFTLPSSLPAGAEARAAAAVEADPQGPEREPSPTPEDPPMRAEHKKLTLPIEAVGGSTRSRSKEHAATATSKTTTERGGQTSSTERRSASKEIASRSASKEIASRSGSKEIASRSGSKEIASRSASKEIASRSASKEHADCDDPEAKSKRPASRKSSKEKPLMLGPSVEQEIMEASGSKYALTGSFERFGLSSLPAFSDHEVPEYLRWTVDSVSFLNHNCIELKLSNKNVPDGARQQDVAGEVFQIDICKEESGEDIRRSYTPASTKEEYRKGKLVLMVKVYPRGPMSQYLSNVCLGDEVMVSRPEPTLDPGDLNNGVVMVAGGSAITVALQVCLAVLRRKAGTVPVYLVLCNRVAEDIVYVHVLETLVENYRNFHLVHCLSEGTNRGIADVRVRWHLGLISKSVLLPAAKHKLKCVLSGPPGLLRATTDILIDLGLGEQDIIALDAIAERCQPLDAMHGEEEFLPQAVAEMRPSPKKVDLDIHPAAKTSKEPDSEPKPSEPAVPGVRWGFGLLGSFLCCSSPNLPTTEDREGALVELMSG